MVTVSFFGIHWLALCLPFLLWRLISLKRPSVLVTGILACLLAFCLCLWTQKSWLNTTVTRQANIKQTVLILPDEIKITGNTMTGKARDINTGQREIFIYPLTPEKASDPVMSNLSMPMLWTIEGQIQPILPRTNDNQFDNQRYNYHQHICNQMRIKKVDQMVVQRGRGIVICHIIRKRLSLYFARLPRPLSTYCQQLIIGSSDDNTTELMVSVKKLGLLHLFCISGMHIVLLTVMVRYLLVYLWWYRENIDIFLIILLPFYLIIGGGSVSLLRATIMAEIGLLHKYFHLDSLDGWAISLLIGLMIDPLALLTLGGQLSYLLSFMLQVFPVTLSNLKQSFFLNLVSLPSMLSYVYEVHILSFIVSYLVIPFFSVIIFPSVLIGAISFRLVPTVTYIINAGLKYFQLLLDWLSLLPGTIHFGKPPLILAVVLFIGTLVMVYRQLDLRGWLLLALIYVLTFLTIHFPINGEVTFIDIGQGDSILIREPFNKKVIMIDTGGKLVFNQFRCEQKRQQDDAQRVTINYLKSKGINQIDVIFLSHHDADHIGYLPTILSNIRVKQIVVPAGMENQPAFLKKFHGVAKSQVPLIIPVTDNDDLNRFPLQVLHPFTAGQGKNEDSLVLAGTFGGKRFVFTGDLDQQNEKKVIQKYPQLKADILKIGHHGSKTASNPEFLQALAPQYAIISAGRFNRYHHPDEVTINTLRQLSINYLSTQQFGMIKYVYYGEHGKIKTTLKGDETRWTLPNYLIN
ncbi:DNA internalization-related competence protein ComEC/Rec2 [Limosilactobacillus rudii]|uniref:DNA internalization-related competence protein ComEC/Rec2 n=1 Tax=Limosilactobacillus rudii TaxID=2759755 RepID=UPI002D80C49C|nr:DNA internalization-related competence protein ComEC/Rec2 [Limosilactobacillus rudii]